MASDAAPSEPAAVSPFEGPAFHSTGRVLFGATNSGTYPGDLTAASERWLLWAPDNGRKIPRNPEWGMTDKDEFDGFALCSPKDPRAWRSFAAAKQAAQQFDLELGYYLPTPDWTDWQDTDLPDGYSVDNLRAGEPHVGLVDLDHVRAPDSGRVAEVARQFIGACAQTFAEWSPSGTGAHILGRFELPPDVSSLSLNLATPDWPNASIELYDGGRFTTMTGDHIPGTARKIAGIQPAVNALLVTHADTVAAARTRSSEPAARPDAATTGPPAPLTDLETTTDIEVIYEIIERTTPAEIELKSAMTEQRADGTRSRNPCWADSESGTRLAEFDDGWMWRDGEIVLDALQVVALEEEIISDPQAYPSGSDWWAAVDALRDRGVAIPRLVNESPGET